MAPAFLRAGPARYGVALAGLVPAGRTPTAFLGDRVRALHADRWPEQPTWIVAYRTRDGRRVVFGRDDVDVPDLATAVEASSAVPGRFAPVRLPSGRYLDGAVFSPTNVGLVAGLGFDLVVVSAPMSAPARTPAHTSAGTPADQSLGARARGWFSSLLQRRGRGHRGQGHRRGGVRADRRGRRRHVRARRRPRPRPPGHRRRVPVGARPAGRARPPLALQVLGSQG